MALRGAADEVEEEDPEEDELTDVEVALLLLLDAAHWLLCGPPRSWRRVQPHGRRRHAAPAETEAARMSSERLHLNATGADIVSAERALPASRASKVTDPPGAARRRDAADAWRCASISLESNEPLWTLRCRAGQV